MGFWDDNKDAIPGAGGNFVKFETPGTECQGAVTGMSTHTWAPRANPRTGVMETKTSPVVLFTDEKGAAMSVTLPTHAARLAFEQRLDVGDRFRIRFTHQEGNTKKFVLQVEKGAGAAAPTAIPPGQGGHIGQDANGAPQIQAIPAVAPTGNPWAPAPSAPPLAPTGTGGAPW
jgi:hypothetical protein